MVILADKSVDSQSSYGDTDACKITFGRFPSSSTLLTGNECSRRVACQRIRISSNRESMSTAYVSSEEGQLGPPCAKRWHYNGMMVWKHSDAFKAKKESKRSAKAEQPKLQFKLKACFRKVSTMREYLGQISVDNLELRQFVVVTRNENHTASSSQWRFFEMKFDNVNRAPHPGDSVP